MSVDVKTNVIKRNGEEVDFNSQKIINAVHKANAEVDRLHQMNDYQIIAIADSIANKVHDSTHAVNVEDIQDMVETGIMAMRGYEVAQKYVRYRYKRELTRKSNTTDNGILSLLDNINEEVNQENSNKNPVINSTQRDYMAGEVSKDLSRRVLLPEEIVKAHEEGIIHFHDTDYFAQREHNCDLINLEDMLQNGTVISETLIEKPHSFFTACNVTTQIVAQVASNQYGGQSFTLAHLAPFVDISRRKIRKNVIEERKECGESLDENIISRVTERRLRDEIRSGIQTIQYQLITLMTCNGQAPFVTVFMYLDEVPEGQTRDDLAMIIEEVLVQRMQGVKNEKGVWITPAFPKLIYVLDEDNTLYKNLNKQMISIEKLESKIDVHELKSMLKEHQTLTGSEKAQEVLEHFTEYLPKFKKIIPYDYKKMTALSMKLEEQGMSTEQAQMEAFTEVFQK